MSGRRLLASAVLITMVALCLAAGGRWLARKVYPLHYADLIGLHADMAGVDPWLISAVIRAESGFDPLAESNRGARGLMQIMPATGEWIAGRMGVDRYDPALLFEPEFNIRLGCWYLADLHREFDGDLILTLAAYNGGRGRVTEWREQAVARGETFAGQRALDLIPYPETVAYVRRVLTYRAQYQRIYGYDAFAQERRLSGNGA